MATTQYRRPIKYSETTLKEAETNLQKLRTALENAQFRLQNSKEGFPEGTDHAILAEFEQRFVQEMDDDF